MPRKVLFLFLGAGLLLGALPLLPAAPDDESTRRTELLLAVQRALGRGREFLKAGHYKAAVETLEREFPTALPIIFENRDYLRALSDAYVGYIAELNRANRPDDAAVYQRRLATVDPGAMLELRGTPAPPRPAELATKSILPAPPSATAKSTVPSLIPLAMARQDAVTARGQVRDDDPFEPATDETAQAAQVLLDQAEAEFEAATTAANETARAGHYSAAGRLFEQAERALKGTTASAKERWAYCKLHGVVSTLNRGSGVPTQELDREVRLAMSMSPKLDNIGRDLLRRIQERQGSGAAVVDRVEEAVVAVRSTPRQGNGWARAETTHFRVFHLQSQEFGEKVARVAESARLMAARKWFGEALPAWSTRCDIYVHNTAEDYARATSQSPQCPGHSTMPMEGARVLERRIDLHCDDPNLCPGVLPHEVTHVTLAGRFPAALPHWADEGMAVLSEPRDRVERHLRNLPTHAQRQELFHVGTLMGMDRYPEPRLVGAFYAQSVSLVDYLSRLRGPQTFAQFLAEGMRGGNFESALKKYYNLSGYAELTTSWQRQAFGEGMARAAQP